MSAHRRGIAMTRALLAAGVAMALSFATPAFAQSVGKVGAVNQNAKGTPPGAGAHTLSLGGDVVQRERIDTTADGNAQIAFNDSSSLNVGRNSSITIDRFVYDPGGGVGQMSTNLARGALRFVGGQISHTEGVTIKTRAATIGIRGGIATMQVGPNGSLTVVSGAGHIHVQNAAGAQDIDVPGYQVVVPGPNSPPGAPQPVDPSVLAALMAQFSSVGTQTGGAQTPPTDANASLFGIGSPRGDAQSPNFDLPPVTSDIARGRSNSVNQSLGVPPPSNTRNSPGTTP
jgi:hypothetical protein